MKTSLPRLVAFSLVALFWARTSAETITLNPIADTSLFENNPDNNLGTSSLAAGTINNVPKKSRALIQFDIANSVPANATITSVMLHLNVIRTPSSGGTGSTFHLHRVLKSWDEGEQGGNTGGPADTDETTWNARFHPSTLWTTNGAAAGFDYIATSSGSQFMDGGGDYAINSTAQMIADVELWKNTDTNFGWILISANEGTLGTARRFGNKEDTINPPPMLMVEYTVPSVTSPTITGVTRTNNQVRFDFTAAANQSYIVESTTSLSPSNWGTLTNVSATAGGGPATISDNITSTNKYYRIKTP